MLDPYLSDESSDDDDDDDEGLTPGEIRLKLERRQQREDERERRALNAATASACCTVVLNDKGTRLGAELRVGGGIIVTHSSFPGRPCLLTTAGMVPDAYHAAHATVHFNGAVAPTTAKLASGDFFVVSSDASLLDDFPPGEIPLAKGISYSIVRAGWFVGGGGGGWGGGCRGGQGDAWQHCRPPRVLLRCTPEEPDGWLLRSAPLGCPGRRPSASSAPGGPGPSLLPGGGPRRRHRCGRGRLRGPGRSRPRPRGPRTGVALAGAARLRSGPDGRGAPA
jgi:hypothetical protein